MKVGILNAISPELSQINWGGSPIDAYIRFLQRADPPFTYTGFEVAQGKFPSSPDDCDAYVITGSPRGVYDNDAWIGKLAHFIRDCYGMDKKLVGICFGHQILAQALGGRAEKWDKGWGLGLKQFEIRESKPWMTGETGQCSLYFAHQDQVTRLPQEAELLGGNAFCPNALYTIRDQVLGVQGHPEFTIGIMEELLARPKNSIDDGLLQEASDSLKNGAPDSLLWAHWIVNFLTGQVRGEDQLT